MSAVLVMPLLMMASCGKAAVPPFTQYSEYAVCAANVDDAADVKWATYLKSHFQKRATDKDCIIAAKAADASQLQVNVDLDPSMSTDYAVERDDQHITLRARTTEAMLWLQYQFMAAASEQDARFTTDDLPAAVLSCTQDTAGTFAFEYRGIYSPSNTNADLMPILGTHNVDFDWGLWGHNLRKVFTDGIPQEAYALVGGNRDSEQFCFSSEALYNAYENYIIDQYGEGNNDEIVRFAVMPNDNSIVCMCAACRAAGNNAASATPAVTKMVERLARRFPKHQFFTSSYTTTATPPTHRLPDNVGVLVSTLALPLQTKMNGSTAEQRKFETTMKTWKNVSRHIYVWDYMRNFDDYITPYPCMEHIKTRLQYFKKMGVDGVFYNGSGYDYASFDDVQTYVIAQLMLNPDADITQLVSHYYDKAYPETASIYTDYYLSLEQKAKQATLNPYSGIGEAVRMYLDADALENFWHKLDGGKGKAVDTERRNINEMLTALAFTRLELLRLQPKAPSAEKKNELLSLLSAHTAFKDLNNYRESFGEVDKYIAEWRTSSPWLINNDNKLRGTSITSTTKLDPEYADLSVLTDGKAGFASDYHTGWLLNSSAQLSLTAPQGKLSGNSTLQLTFLQAPQWHIFAPASVEVWQGGKLIGKTMPVANEGRNSVKVMLSGVKISAPVEIMVNKAERSGRATIAVDEIEVM
ncbi:DUF4838 domain-containing protein [uncultured Prevotella sp.]|uniref:DUF4838 domain-containing protein n=1 Tax=uncultured Prevotella sp. TaxID=159272 RepID=UPI0027E3B1A3|nr:DUF4838 domain-containing protein [uncultured Prevotella sp.]